MVFNAHCFVNPITNYWVYRISFPKSMLTVFPPFYAKNDWVTKHAHSAWQNTVPKKWQNRWSLTINNLPRKILGYHTPEELFEKELDRIYTAWTGTAVSSFPSSLRSSLNELTAFYCKFKNCFNLLLQFTYYENRKTAFWWREISACDRWDKSRR